MNAPVLVFSVCADGVRVRRSLRKSKGKRLKGDRLLTVGGGPGQAPFLLRCNLLPSGPDGGRPIQNLRGRAGGRSWRRRRGTRCRWKALLCSSLTFCPADVGPPGSISFSHPARFFCHTAA